jgi:CBS domain containing-hemolysin-like protein
MAVSKISVIVFYTLLCCLAIPMLLAAQRPAMADQAGYDLGDARLWHEYLPPSVLFVVTLMLIASAFFSSCESAFFAIQRTRLRAMREEETWTSRMVVHMLDHPGQLLTTILIGNMIANTLIGVVLGTRVKDLFEFGFRLPAVVAYSSSAVVCTSVLLFFGEIVPKVFAVQARETYARVAVVPLVAVDYLFAPFRKALLWLTEFLFRVTRFHELHAAPYITDEELKSVLAQEPEGEIQEDGRQMIRRILEFRDVQLREILVPRPDIIALPEDATVEEALALYREHECSRMPVYHEDLDHITSVLFAKDLLPSYSKGQSDRLVRELARPPHYVPETMTVHNFIKNVQRLRSHLAVVVDEYGGTEGIVTLHDAIEQVVGDILDEGEEEPLVRQIAEGVYRVDGGLSLDELQEWISVSLGETEHQTVAGFIMERSEKIPAVGDEVSFDGITFTVEQVEGKRASVVRVQIAPPPNGEAAP